MRYNRMLIVLLSGLMAACTGVDTPSTARPSFAARTVSKRNLHVVPAQAKARQGHRRAALAGPTTTQPTDGANASTDRPPGHPLFRLLDANRDGKLQPTEITRMIDVLKTAEEASKNGDLTPEQFGKYMESLRPHGGKGLRAGKGKRAGAKNQ